MSQTSVNLCSRALVKLGASPISGFHDGTAEGEVAGLLYESVRDGLMSAHDWNFATTRARLARLADDAQGDAGHGRTLFQLPGDCLTALAVEVPGSNRALPYAVIGDRIEAAADSIILTYVRRLHESAYPAFFKEALIARLAAEFCLPLTESASRARMLGQTAEAALRTARKVDRQQVTPGAFIDFALVEARGQ